MTQKVVLNIFVLLSVCLINIAITNAIELKCGYTTNYKNVELRSPATLTQQSCEYTIKASSKYVSQMRIDFAMELAQPSVSSINNNYNHSHCKDDYFEVKGLRFCGLEYGQHIYVGIDYDAGETQLDIRFVTAKRLYHSNSTELPLPWWTMEIRQLEGHLSSDMALIAPIGCLQYFPKKDGYIRSFNYNDGKGIYTGYLHYAICFRRTKNTDIVEFNNVNLKLNVQNESLQLDKECYPEVYTDGASEDFLMIPHATILKSGIRATYFCGSSTNALTIRSTPPGTLMIFFNSDGIYHDRKELGFSLYYRILELF